MYHQGLLPKYRIRDCERQDGWTWDSDILTGNLKWDDGGDEEFFEMDDDNFEDI